AGGHPRPASVGNLRPHRHPGRRQHRLRRAPRRVARRPAACRWPEAVPGRPGGCPPLPAACVVVVIGAHSRRQHAPERTPAGIDAAGRATGPGRFALAGCAGARGLDHRRRAAVHAARSRHARRYRRADGPAGGRAARGGDFRRHRTGARRARRDHREHPHGGCARPDRHARRPGPRRAPGSRRHGHASARHRDAGAAARSGPGRPAGRSLRAARGHERGPAGRARAPVAPTPDPVQRRPGRVRHPHAAGLPVPATAVLRAFGAADRALAMRTGPRRPVAALPGLLLALALAFACAGTLAAPAPAPPSADAAATAGAPSPFADIAGQLEQDAAAAIAPSTLVRQDREDHAAYLRWQREFSRRSWEWHLHSTRLLMYVVLVIVAFGLFITYLQFTHDRRPRRRVALPATGGGADRPASGADPGQEGDATTGASPPSSLKLGPAGIEITSQVIGLLVLAFSLAFFYFYIKDVYPMQELGLKAQAKAAATH